MLLTLRLMMLSSCVAVRYLQKQLWQKFVLIVPCAGLIGTDCCPVYTTGIVESAHAKTKRNFA